MSKSRKSTAVASKTKLPIAALNKLKTREPSAYSIAFDTPLEPAPNSQFPAGDDVVIRCTGHIALTASAPASQFSLVLYSIDGSPASKGTAGVLVLTVQPGCTEQFELQAFQLAATPGHYSVEAVLSRQGDSSGMTKQTSDYTVT